MKATVYRCTGCGDERQSPGRALPAGWLRLRVYGASPDQTARVHAVLDVCQPMCAARALDLLVTPAAPALSLVAANRPG